MTTLAFNLNGKDTSLDVSPADMLAHVLRDRLGLIGTKIGCGEGECGACTVLVDGKAVASCIYPALKARGRRVQTIDHRETRTPCGTAVSPLITRHVYGMLDAVAEYIDCDGPTGSTWTLAREFVCGAGGDGTARLPPSGNGRTRLLPSWVDAGPRHQYPFKPE